MFGRKLPRSRLASTAAALLVLAIGVSVAYQWVTKPRPATVPFSDFLRDVKAGQVSAVTADGDAIVFERRDEARFETVAPQGYLALNPTFVSELMERGVRFDVSRARQSHESSYTTVVLGVLLFAGVGLTLYRIVTGRVPSLERARTVEAGDVTVTFNDVAGVDEAKDEVREIVDFLKEPGRYASISTLR